jgi:predicted CXXCH cytochrome family protein
MPGWKPAIFEHSSFPLTQGHAINDCNACHVPGDYSNVSTDCFACHEADYNATTNPNHLSAGIDNVCMTCHTTMPGWKPADFAEHDGLFFPIYSGRHRGEWNTCTDCHSNTSNYSVFSCIDCHEHNRADMDDKHSGENGYEYTSVACLDCHPTGSHE